MKLRFITMAMIVGLAAVSLGGMAPAFDAISPATTASAACVIGTDNSCLIPGECRDPDAPPCGTYGLEDTCIVGRDCIIPGQCRDPDAPPCGIPTGRVNVK